MLVSKLPEVGTTIFSVMSQLAAEHGAINLSQGFPDFPAPQPLLEAVARHVLAGHNQYAPMAGVPALCQCLAEHVRQAYARELDPVAEVTVTPGATQGIFCAIQTVVRPGDEVIVLDPCYDSYEPGVQLAGGRCVHVSLDPQDFGIDWTALEAAITARTRLLILNTPHNPSGAVLALADLQRLADLLRDRDIYLISDEVYEHLIYDGQSHASVLRHAELYARAFVIGSFGKTFHVTGWKTGFVIAPPSLTAELRKVHQFVSFAAVTPLQWALADFMREHPEHLAELPAFYQHKRDLFCRGLAGSRLSFMPTPGTYFQLVDYSAVRPDLDDVAMARWLTETHGVASIPVSVFYASAPVGQRLIRFCFAKQDATLQRAGEILSTI